MRHILPFVGLFAPQAAAKDYPKRAHHTAKRSQRQRHRRRRFRPAVSPRMFSVARPRNDSAYDERHKRDRDIGERIDAVAQNGKASGKFRKSDLRAAEREVSEKCDIARASHECGMRFVTIDRFGIHSG